MNLCVSDHAVLRYLERVLEIDVEGVRKLILKTVRSGVAAGAVSVKADGMFYPISDGVVTTCFSQKQAPGMRDEA